MFHTKFGIKVTSAPTTTVMSWQCKPAQFGALSEYGCFGQQAISSARSDDHAVPAILRPSREDVADVAAWVSSGLNFESNVCSRLHTMKEAVWSTCSTVGLVPSPIADMLCVENTFVVCQDWSALLSGAQGIEDEFRLPFDRCFFEFRISGRTVVVLAVQDGTEVVISAYINLRQSVWFVRHEGNTNSDPLFMFLMDQIRCICIALDAEIGARHTNPAPAKLNEKRARAGKIPLSDYHVVELSKRSSVCRRAAGNGSSATSGSIRLHFRRGHYRVVAEKKIWVKWCLVGNPALGFVPHHYAA